MLCLLTTQRGSGLLIPQETPPGQGRKHQWGPATQETHTSNMVKLDVHSIPIAEEGHAFRIKVSRSEALLS